MKWYHSILFHPFIMRFVGDPYYNGEVCLCFGMTTNIIFALINGFTGYRFKSIWFMALCIYYVVLAIIRLTIFYSIHRQNQLLEEYDVAPWDRVCEWKPYRRTGILLLVLTLSMSGMVIQMIFDDRSFLYPDYILYVFFGFTLYLIIGSICNMYRYRKWGFPSLSSSAAVSFTGALMALLAVQSAYLHQFEMEVRMMVNGIGGFIVLMICLLFDIGMIKKGFYQVYRCKNKLPMKQVKGIEKYISYRIERRD